MPPKLFRDDPKGGKTLDSYTRKRDVPGCLTSVAFWLLMVGAGVGLKACGVINTRPTRTPIESLPALNVRPNLNFNLNYNVRPLNLPPPLTAPTPRGRRKRRAQGNDNATPSPPPATVEQATPARE